MSVSDHEKPVTTTHLIQNHSLGFPDVIFIPVLLNPRKADRGVDDCKIK
jgi:hypothetical protein